MTDRAGRAIARLLVAVTGAVIWHYGYHACAIGYFFFIILNRVAIVEKSEE